MNSLICETDTMDSYKLRVLILKQCYVLIMAIQMLWKKNTGTFINYSDVPYNCVLREEPFIPMNENRNVGRRKPTSKEMLNA